MQEGQFVSAEFLWWSHIYLAQFLATVRLVYLVYVRKFSENCW